MLGGSNVGHCRIKHKVFRSVIWLLLFLLRQYLILVILVKLSIAVLSNSLLQWLNLTALLHEDIAISRRLEVTLLR